VPGEHLLPALLSAFRGRHPHVQVRATVADSRAALSQVEQGRAHLGLVGGRGDSLNLEYRCFDHDRLVLVVPPDHPWARRRHIPLQALCREPLILRETGSASRHRLVQALAEAGRCAGDLRVVLELGSNEAIAEAVREGLGLAVLSERAVRREVEAGRLCALGVSGLSLEREMLAAWDRRRVLPAHARLFLDLLGPDCCPRHG
jgi:DNA-binding transcriptional LysR family regulator